MQKIKKGDDVIIIAGKDKGKRGAVLRRILCPPANPARPRRERKSSCLTGEALLDGPQIREATFA